jgi:hypothetical protein
MLQHTLAWEPINQHYKFTVHTQSKQRDANLTNLLQDLLFALSTISLFEFGTFLKTVSLSHINIRDLVEEGRPQSPPLFHSRA